MAQPLISIIVTSYNVVDYIDQCLKALINQTIKEIEIIVVDDASKDGTVEIIKKYEQNDARIKLFALPENTVGGTGIPGNIGIDNATGKYIGFADGDDWCEPNMFELLYQKAEEVQADFTMCDYREAESSESDPIEPADAHRWDDLRELPNVVGSTLEEKQALLRMIAVPWRKLYKHSFVKQHDIRYPEGDYFFEDNPLHWFAIVSAERVAFVDSVLYYHRVNRQGQTMSTADNGLVKMFIHHGTIYAWLEKKGLLKEFKIPLCQWLISQMHWISRTIAPQFREELFSALKNEFKKYSLLEVKKAIVNNKENPFGSALVVAVRTNKFNDFCALLDETKKADPYHPQMILYRETPASIASFLGKTVVKKTGGVTGRNRAKKIEERLARIEAKLDKVLIKTTIIEPSVMWLMQDMEELKKITKTSKTKK